jgi:hypothetical protein
MGFLNKIFGYRWSLYIVQNQRELVYAMHENDVFRIVGYVMLSFADGAKPVAPWSLHLNFNKKQKSFELKPEHFTPDGNNVTRLLKQEIEAIDPGWDVPGHEPIFVEVASKISLPITSVSSATEFNLEDYMKKMAAPEQVTFSSVMRIVFGKADA